MESIVHAALEEICAQGTNGLAFSELWPKLNTVASSNDLTLCRDVKRALWLNIINIPGLQFESVQGGQHESENTSLQSLEECERIKVKIVASKVLLDSFCGIYDVRASDIIPVQRRTLERLAFARINGITQCDLAKEFGMKANSIFQHLKKLEIQGLIVRQPTLIKTQEVANDKEPRSSSVMSTNMLHLTRYAKGLGAFQRLEITKEDKPLVAEGNLEASAATEDGHADKLVKEDVFIKDFLPDLKAICDKLEKAEGRVLVVADIKQDLGYQGRHKAWRKICHRLKDARIVEEFRAKVNNENKEVNCLRLLKNFSWHFESKSRPHRSVDLDTKQPENLGKRGQVSEQLLELPIERQIYDMVDAEGSKGLTIIEVFERLGLGNKQYYSRLTNMCSRFGMHLQAERHNKGSVYRVWTSKNYRRGIVPGEPVTVLHEDIDHSMVDVEFNDKSAQTLHDIDASTCKDNAVQTRGDHKIVACGSKKVPCGSLNCSARELHLVDHEDSTQTDEEIDALICKDDRKTIHEIENKSAAIEPDSSGGSTTDKEYTFMTPSHNSSKNFNCEPTDRGIADVDVKVVSAAVSGSSLLESSPTVVSPSQRRRSYLKYPCPTLETASAQREKLILKMLQEEKFLIKRDLRRRLESFVKDQSSKMDTKTLQQMLKKLQQEGYCKCIHVCVPSVTNCDSSRTILVVLHPSLSPGSSLSPELLCQIHERLRSFEMQVHCQSSSHLKKGEDVPILNSIQRISKNVKSEGQAEIARLMRDNGYILAKMVRTKLLHIFLWSYINSFSVRGDGMSYGRQVSDLKSPDSTYIAFDLDAAIKAMPLELFLKVVGSTRRFDNMVEKCGKKLSDLSVDEYKHLMGRGPIRATARLSLLIDILRRLKLLRLVSGSRLEDVYRSTHTSLTHALELKPFLEEPVSIAASSLGFSSTDLRPQIRHDFVLSSRKAVDEYWNTLEYCYSAAVPEAAQHAFPGFTVCEVFRHGSWVSVQQMTPKQRAKLHELVTKDPNKKLPFKDCQKIAKSLGLTLKQVLHHLTGLQQALRTKNGETQQAESADASSSRKRKRTSNKCSRHPASDYVDGESNIRMPELSLATVDELEGAQHSCITSEDHYCSSDKGFLHNNIQAEKARLNEDEDDRGSIHDHALSRQKLKCQNWFSWTEAADRQLIMVYVRHHVVLGENFLAANWASFSDLPAPPDTCKRRMGALLENNIFRGALMKLRNIVMDRYVTYLELAQKRSSDTDDSGMMTCDQDFSNEYENTQDFHIKCWDNFDDPDIKTVLEDVLRYKKAATLVVLKGAESAARDAELNASAHTQKVENRVQNDAQHSSSYHLPPHFLGLSNEGISVNIRAVESVAVSNAIELFKLIFLSKSTTAEVPTLIAETLRRYSEHDLFAAFNYLRENKIMISGSGMSPFLLSENFLQSISQSPFPINTGERAAHISNWLHERERDLMEEGIDLLPDLQCGDIFQLCGLLSLGDLSITPYLPDEGVGEVEDTSSLKRTIDKIETGGSERSKKLRSSFDGGEIISRRKKGFPGIGLLLGRVKISRMDALEFYKDKYVSPKDLEHIQVDLMSGSGVDSILSDPNEPNSSTEVGDSCGSTYRELPTVATPWEAMTCYAEHLLSSCSYSEIGSSFLPELFRNVCSAIQKAGDQGLSTAEVSTIMNIQGEKTLGIAIDVLEAFGRALKVNGYDAVHLVDPFYRFKYFLVSTAGFRQDPCIAPLRDSKEKYEVLHQIPDMRENHDVGVDMKKEMSTNVCIEHQITLLNVPEGVVERSREIIVDNTDSFMHSKCNYEGENYGVERNTLHSGYSCSNRPILPWFNADGTLNDVVYNGLVRRALGIVMQHPGISKEDIIAQMSALTPQSCKELLEMMILDNHISVREIPQAASAEPPPILQSLIGRRLERMSSCVSRKHFFANPLSAGFL